MITALLLSAVAAIPAGPQAHSEAGWLAWQGCWHAEGESADRMLCILPAEGGARFITVAAGAIESDQHVVADGAARPISREGCSGTQQAQWSADGQRVFMTSDMTCGEAVHRGVTGIMTMRSLTEWLSVQAVTSGENTVARVIRYTAVDHPALPADLADAFESNQLARETARYAAISLLDLADVQEALHAVDETVVGNWLTAMNQQFDLTGESLIALADAGVPADIIDVLVAVSNPDYFAVQTVAARDDDDFFRRPRLRGYGACYDPFENPYGGPLSYGYGYSSCGRRSFYSPWGYDPYRWNAGTTPVIIIRGEGGSGGSSPHAKVTRKGYSSGSSSDEIARPADRRAAPTHTASPRPSSSSSSGSSGRTAKPRDK